MIPLSDADVERVAADTAWVCAIPAPTFHEEARAGAVLSSIAEAGLTARKDAVGNVIARLGGDGPALALCAHLDSVFPDEEEIPVTRSGIRLAGRGIGDNALGVAALLHVARTLAATPPTQPIILAATVGEEGLGDLRGVKALLDEEPIRALIAIEGHGIDSLAVGGIAALRYDVEFSGPGGHSWSDRGRGSAVHAAILASERLLAAGSPAAINIGRIEGGTAVNAIAEHATLLIDIRHEETHVVEAAARRVDHALRASLPAGIEPGYDGMELVL
jgi:acetylornithine deacetylase/succinyl-diaminopimelate desuccinylase-like protein